MTDDRDFDNRLTASSRMHSSIELDLVGVRELSSDHRCDPTHEVDCEDGDNECTERSDTSRMRFKDVRGSSSLVHVDLIGEANNPCFSGSPDIDYEGTITIEPAARTVQFSGMIDEFPAFEMYAKTDGGPAVTVFRTLPLPTNEPWNLMGKAARSQAGQATL